MVSPSPALDLLATVHACVTLARIPHQLPGDAIHRAATISRRLMLALAACAQAGWSREQMRAAVAPARDVYAGSPFAKRLQTWPRGYPGDFETVEYILDRQNRAEPGTLAYGLEQVALDSPIAAQHRHKVRIQSQAILDTAIAQRDRRGGARVLVLASGGAADVRMVQDELVELGARVVLLDQDATALAFALERVPRLAPSITTVCRSVVRGLVPVQAHGPFDLVVAGGLFDYLPDALICRVLQQVRARLLAPSGQVFFTNIALENPFQLWIECLADWHLIHRSAEDLRRLCRAAGYDAGTVAASRDPTGLAFIVRCAASGRHRAQAKVGAALAAAATYSS